ncbi:MAG: ester cyclase [Actinobacteria bacterium]|nr:ester cyclase [Actinomycetota bacterium]
MADESSALIRSLFDAFNDGHLVRAAATVSDDFELIDVASGQTFHGPEGCRRWLEIFKTALPDAKTEILEFIATGTHAASEHIGRGTHTGPFVSPAGTIPPTGRNVELRIAEIYEVREGKIAKLHAYYDTATLMRQLGLLPRSGSAAERTMTALMGAGIKAKRTIKGD